MRIPDRTLSEIVDRLDPVEVVGDYVQLKKAGTRYKALCPFHSEKTPSFTVNPENGLYYCFGCQKGGNLYGFVMEMEGVSFVEAAEILAKRAGVELDVGPEKERSLKRDAYTDLYRKVAGVFQHLLLNKPSAGTARDYLNARGIGAEILNRFAVGYAPSDRRWLGRFLVKKNYTRDFLVHSGLFSARTGAQGGEMSAFFYDRIMFPISNARGETIAFGGRALQEGAPKYVNSPETDYFRKGENLFGMFHAVKEIRSSGFFYLVEGYMDVLSLHEAGVQNVVAPLGTALTDAQARVLKRYAEKTILLFDSDPAGVRATLRVLNTFESNGLTVEVVELPEAKDPAEILQRSGAESLGRALKGSVSGFRFILDQALKAFDGRTPQGKEEVLRFMHPYLSVVASDVKREGYLRSLAEELRVEFESVRGDFERIGRSSPTSTSPPPEQQTANLGADLFLMLAIAVNGSHFEQARRIISEQDLEDPEAREVFIALEECYREGDISLMPILNRLDSERLRTLIAEKAASDEFGVNQERLISESLENTRRRSLEKKRGKIVALLRQTETEKSDVFAMRELLQEKMFLDGELQKMKVR